MNADCDAVRQAHPLEIPGGKQHRASCPDCRAFAAAWELLRVYPATSESPDFFRGLRRKLAPRILRFMAPVAAAAAVLLLATVLFLQPGPGGVAGPSMTDEERELVENLDLLENYDLLRTLELVGEPEERK